ncbi:hypothetical protein IAG43_00015 [Streptomyces genisteinicus]|uniref:Uncharacterized protein n=2 Tax=Streptomyces genisteinicus TaxID=2768068 RepID=A0A7H0I302_9ACTN|nr:hypothetical protein IAG43_00015 [Streptomyces genisteinicus]
MYGGELALQIQITHLLFVERQPDGLRLMRQDWHARGFGDCALGIKGPLRDVFPQEAHSDEIASVYAEFAHVHGWLRPDRALTADAHKALTDSVRAWAAADRTWADITQEFGAPSVLIGGINPRYPKTLCYLTDDPRHPIVSFHLWNGSEPDAETWPVYEQPKLLAVRSGGGSFHASLTLTPEGERRRPVDDSCPAP